MASLCLGFCYDKLPLLLHRDAWSSARTKAISFNYIWSTIQDSCFATRFGQFYGLFWRCLYLSLTFDNAIGARVFKMQTLKFPWRQPMKPIRMGQLIFLPWAVSKLAFIRQISAVHTLMERYLLMNKSLHLDLSWCGHADMPSVFCCSVHFAFKWKHDMNVFCELLNFHRYVNPCRLCLPMGNVRKVNVTCLPVISHMIRTNRISGCL